MVDTYKPEDVKVFFHGKELEPFKGGSELEAVHPEGAIRFDAHRVRHEVAKRALQGKLVAAIPRSKRAPLDDREQALALSLSYAPGKVPPLPPERALKVVKRAVKLRTRRAELRRAKAKRRLRARASARVAATSRGRNR